MIKDQKSEVQVVPGVVETLETLITEKTHGLKSILQPYIQHIVRAKLAGIPNGKIAAAIYPYFKEDYNLDEFKRGFSKFLKEFGELAKAPSRERAKPKKTDSDLAADVADVNAKPATKSQAITANVDAVAATEVTDAPLTLPLDTVPAGQMESQTTSANKKETFRGGVVDNT